MSDINSFDLGQGVEAIGTARIAEWLYDAYFDIQPITERSEQCQEGDYRAIDQSGRETVLELKTESRYTGNLFLEEWSNLTEDMQSRGWVKRLERGVLIYTFLDKPILIEINIPALYKWANDENCNLERFRATEQGKYQQRNRTIGRIVPISVLQEELGPNLRIHLLSIK
jgi:hypothetical protein